MRVRFAKHIPEPLIIRPDAATLAALRTAAQKKGLGPTTLARMWILEHLAQAQAS